MREKTPENFAASDQFMDGVNNSELISYLTPEQRIEAVAEIMARIALRALESSDQ